MDCTECNLVNSRKGIRTSTVHLPIMFARRQCQRNLQVDDVALASVPVFLHQDKALSER